MGTNEELLRDAYALFAKGDIDGFFALCTNDLTLHVPGSSPLAGDHVGKEGFLSMMGKVMEISGGTFSEDVHDVTTSAEHGVVLTVHHLQRGGKAIDYNSAHAWHIRDGKLAEFWELPEDQQEYDAAWS